MAFIGIVVILTLKVLRSQSWLLLSNYIHSLGRLIKSQGFKYTCVPMTSQCYL